MAKYKSFSSVVPVAEVAWFKRLNIARLTGDYGDEKDLQKTQDSLTLHGWMQNSNGTVDVEPASDTLAEEAQAERQSEWDRLKESAKTNGNDAIRLKVFELLYTDNGKKLIPVKFVGISGNRRSQVFFRAMVARYESGEPVTTEIPVINHGHLQPLERLAVQVGENEGKTEGFREMSNADRLLAAKRCLQYGGKESHLSKIFKRGMAQKLWAIARLDALWPNARVIERMCLPEGHEEHVPWGIDKEVARKLADRSDPDTLQSLNQRLTAGGKPAEQSATEQEVLAYVTAPAGNGGNKPKILDREAIEGLSKNFPAIPLRMMAKAILERNVDILQPYDLMQSGLNSLDEILKNGDYPPVQLLLAKIVTCKRDNRDQLLKDLIKVTESY